MVLQQQSLRVASCFLAPPALLYHRCHRCHPLSLLVAEHHRWQLALPLPPLDPRTRSGLYDHGSRSQDKIDHLAAIIIVSSYTIILKTAWSMPETLRFSIGYSVECAPNTPSTLLGSTCTTRITPSSLPEHSKSSSILAKASTDLGWFLIRSEKSPNWPHVYKAIVPSCVPHAIYRE
eukprot:m.67988 g.67988  ORF g.67988 m.67988 type:complete len:177 (-) comp14090_c0_seq18:770-1300(-)